jgi:hypothetical protein
VDHEGLLGDRRRCGNPHRTRRLSLISRSSARVAVTNVHGQNT